MNDKKQQTRDIAPISRKNRALTVTHEITVKNKESKGKNSPEKEQILMDSRTKNGLVAMDVAHIILSFTLIWLIFSIPYFHLKKRFLAGEQVKDRLCRNNLAIFIIFFFFIISIIGIVGALMVMKGENE